jgi:hypothetical protein
MTTPNFHFRDTAAVAALSVFLLISFILSAAAQDSSNREANLQPGNILVMDVVGDVKILGDRNPNGSSPAKGTNLAAGDTIVTGAGGRVGLAFSNGSLFEVLENSKFSVQEYLQEPWKFSVEEWNALETEPTKSQTKAFLDYGELVVKVKKLDSASSMQVSTPLGVAGIRGTTFKVRLVRNPDGSPKSASVMLVEGSVDFTPQGGGERTTITPGNSVTVSVTLGPDGQLILNPPVREALSPQEMVLIQQAVRNMLEQSANISALGDTSGQPGAGVDNRPGPMDNTTIPPIVPPPTPTPEPTAPTPTPVPSLL